MSNKPWLRNKEEKFIILHGAKIHYKKLGYGESRKIAEQATTFDKMGRPIKNDVSLAMTLQVVNSITDWELTNNEGEKLPITLDTFDNELDPDFVGEIIQAVHSKIDAGVPEDKKKK
ncbi:hypothetical protein ACS4JF_25420 [Bacillus thuringiensis]|uniref:hypothetical protein n=1 Tax=Bacillus thuringiensis TaxID=1428 RepID=UPI001FAD6D7B|nr:hypothetical protein [Bacillus thuringiensis]MDM8365843.1 hypothetical protein [Bacillus thuringiensis]HDT6579219.1 hypothetical protein [Bacillus cereus]